MLDVEFLEQTRRRFNAESVGLSSELCNSIENLFFFVSYLAKQFNELEIAVQDLHPLDA